MWCLLPTCTTTRNRSDCTLSLLLCDNSSFCHTVFPTTFSGCTVYPQSCCMHTAVLPTLSLLALFHYSDFCFTCTAVGLLNCFSLSEVFVATLFLSLTLSFSLGVFCSAIWEHGLSWWLSIQFLPLHDQQRSQHLQLLPLQRESTNYDVWLYHITIT